MTLSLTIRLVSETRKSVLVFISQFRCSLHRTLFHFFTLKNRIGGCRSSDFLDNMNETTQECNLYQVNLKGSYVGTTDNFGDVVAYLERTIDNPSLVESLNEQNPAPEGQNPYFATKFLGVPIDDAAVDDSLFGGSDEGRENLKQPTNAETPPTQSMSTQDRRTVTIVGGLLVAAFGIVFIGIGILLWRRRQAYLRSTRHLEYHMQPHDSHLDKLSVEGEGGAADPELEPYNTSNTDDLDDDFEENGNQNPQQPNPNNTSGDSSLYMSKDTEEIEDVGGGGASGTGINANYNVDELPSPTDDNVNGGRMQFDLGNSFKDQLMGLHGGSHANSNHNSNRSKRSGRNMLGSLFPNHAQSLDGDSDVDSWAQTDGTIGSLELQLEPITAEV